MRNFSLTVKIYSVLCLLAIMAVGIALMGIWRMGQINGKLTEIVDLTAPQIDLAGRLYAGTLNCIRSQKNVLLAKTAETRAKHIQSMADAEKQVAEDRKNLDELEKKKSNEDTRKLLAQFDGSFVKFSEVNAQIKDLALKDTVSKARELSDGPAAAACKQAADLLRNIQAENNKKSETARAAGNAVNLAEGHETAMRVEQLGSNLVRLHLLELRHIDAFDDAAINQVEKEMTPVQAAMEGHYKYLAGRLGADDRKNFDLYREKQDAFLALHEQIKKLSRENTTFKAEQLSMNEGYTHGLASMKAMQELSDALTRRLQGDKESAMRIYRTAQMWMILGSFIGILVSMTLAAVIIRNMARSLNGIAAGLQRGSEQVASASGQVSQSSQEMAEGASEQASSLEEVSSSLEEMASMTKQNADNAQQANSMAVEAREAAEKGNEAVTRMAQAIDRIKSSSDQTAKIVKTIDEIAFQTNLLALNAAVEAARAGEAGKGFAVVAEEVRNLAQRSAEAAKNTSALIEESQRNAEGGVAVSAEVAETLRSIVKGVEQVAQNVAEVASASEQQSEGIDQINIAVTQMDKVTQQNAANAEESASASEELSAQARELTEIVQTLTRMIYGGAVQAETARAESEGGRMATVAAHSRGASHPEARAHKSAPQGGFEKNTSAANGRKPSRPALQSAAAVKAPGVRPELVIPLEDGEFKEF